MKNITLTIIALILALAFMFILSMVSTIKYKVSWEGLDMEWLKLTEQSYCATHNCDF